MRRSLYPLSLALCLALAGCGSSDGGANQAAADSAVANDTAAAAAGNESADAGAAKKMPDCPFRKTGPWQGSVENGNLLVNGRVDFQMAGFKPTLSVRSTSMPVIAFDLALASDPAAAVSDTVRFESSGNPPYSRGEIWCGGERIESFDMVVVG